MHPCYCSSGLGKNYVDPYPARCYVIFKWFSVHQFQVFGELSVFINVNKAQKKYKLKGLLTQSEMADGYYITLHNQATLSNVAFLVFSVENRTKDPVSCIQHSH